MWHFDDLSVKKTYDTNHKLLIYCSFSRGRVDFNKTYDARTDAAAPYGDEIYIPPSETGSTCKCYNLYLLYLLHACFEIYC